MNATELTAQLAALSDSLKTTNSLISRLAKLQFQPGSEPLDPDGGVRVELAQDIHDSLKQLEEELEFLTQEAEDYKFEGVIRRRRNSRAGEEARITAKVVRLSEELIHSRQQFRNAQITAKLASDEAKRKEREALIESYRREAEQLDTAAVQTDGSAGNDRDLLFAGRGRRNQQQKQLSKDEVLVNATSDVTAALRRTHDLLSTELSRSRFAQETFEESTAALNSLGEGYSNLNDILSNSRNLLGTLLRSQKSDTWYLETAFYILLTTLCWLFFRRILFGPFVKLPLFLWNVFAVLTNWLLLKPLFYLLSAVGVITAEPAVRKVAVSSSSREPLIVQPSAKGRAQPIPVVSGSPNLGVPAGVGGAGAKVGRKSELAGEMSEKVAKMVEQGSEQNEQNQASEPVRRGDGTILEERGETPKNPKKKSFEADTEDAKHEAAQGKKRDEL